jgi:hypothetical protein
MSTMKTQAMPVLDAHCLAGGLPPLATKLPGMR